VVAVTFRGSVVMAITFQAFFVMVATRKRVLVIAITARGQRLRNVRVVERNLGAVMPITDASFAPANPSAWVDVTEEFQARAAECQHLANRSGGEGKRQYEELARQWRELAALVSSRLVV
jgi:hypothetical protein